LEELNVKTLLSIEQEPDLYKNAQQAAGDQTETVVSVDHYSVSLEAGYMVALDSAITPELADEGLARELAHRIQGLRRAAEFELTDRIITYYDAPPAISRIMTNDRTGDYIREETLSEDLVEGIAADAEKVESFKLDGAEVTVGVKRVISAPDA
jgi:isoleucyl-tRNA synthetase